MQVQELMTKNVKMIEPATTLIEAAEIMRNEDVGALPVGTDKRVTGIITDRDIVVRALADYKDPAQVTAGEVMTPRLTTIYADQDVNEAAELMAKDQVRRLLVLDREQDPVGVLSLGDIAQTKTSAEARALEGVTAGEHDPRTWRNPNVT